MAADNSLAWLDRARGREGPIYLAVVEALAAAVRAGELHPGDRLPPQRAVAERLGVDLTTVTRAYSLARERGLLEGAVGRGSFVRAPAAAEDEAGLVDLSMNLPPPPLGLSLGALLADTSAAILARADAAILMAYHPGFGTAGQRAAGARWLAPVLPDAAPERLLVAPGAQAALAAVLASLCRPGDAVACEALTYPGFLGVARQLGLRLVPCPSDADGLIPEALDDLAARQPLRALYLVPTLANPSAATLPLARRQAIADLARRHDLMIVEDDPYSRLLPAPPPALAALAPERAVHIATLAKTLSPGLRIAYVAAPAERLEPLAEALRALALMPPPLMAAVATRWVHEGAADQLLAAVRAEAVARRALAAQALPAARGAAESLHVWLPLPDAPAAQRLRLAAQGQGLALVTAEAFAAAQDHPTGARISLGGASSRAVLARALAALAGLLDAGPPPPRATLV